MTDKITPAFMPDRPAGAPRRAVTVDRFLAGLRDIREDDFTVGNVFDFLKRSPVDAPSLDRYLNFSRNHYTRNLIFKNPLFELVAVCWEVGQGSQIHDHHDQNCWMSMPVGRLRVQNYRVAERDERRAYARVEPTDWFDIHRLAPAAEVDPEEPVHKVSNLPEFNQRAVSLHIYSRPFSTCVVYSPTKNDYRQQPLTYHSEYGKICDGVRL
jgi:cysteine dioxygenase